MVNIPNLLTLLRILLVPVFVILLIQESFLKALLVFSLAGLTDALDGFIARVLRQKTVLGLYLDPLADKALIITSFVTLSVMGMIPPWLAVIVISRDFIILLGISVMSLMSIPYELKPTLISKITTALQLLTVFLVLLLTHVNGSDQAQRVMPLFWLTGTLTVASGFVYIRKGLKFVSEDTAEKEKK
ncbi:MAG TPA: CDP-alcohol phosphatidyltransferase family protein [Syntrophales bacterium]|jgi:cardiolipin synthase|nr:CDP-alcohol phosphatidyltransferase family protein [Syntrophales bacterium]HRT62704.1 CDP-alcohol phosphatidyltransferase family protein [Syntrophales bacterium]